MNTATFSGLEFSLLWEQIGRDVLPYPLQYQHRAPHLGGIARDRRDAALRLRPQLDESLHSALFVLALPEVRVQVAGFAGLEQGHKIRIHAGIRHDLAAVAVQQPGADHETGADVRLTILPARFAARAIIDELPKIPAAQGKPIMVAESDLSAPRETPMLHDVGNSSAREQIRRFLDRPRTGVGHVAVHPGPAYDNRPTDDGRDFHWMDFRDDGRYLTRNGKFRTAEPADAAALASMVQRLIDATRLAFAQH